AEDLVVRLRAAQLREREAFADLDALHGLDAHQGGREARVQTVLLGGVRAEAGRDAARADLHDAADRVAVRPGGVDARLEPLAHDRSRDLDLDRPQQRLRDGTGRDGRGRVPGA